MPKFLVIGAQKAGTSALHTYLSSHPQLVGSQPKELNYFSCEKIFKKGLKFYHSHFHSTDDQAISFETSPSYLHNRVAFKRIYEYNPEMKMIVIVRDPVERAYSAWNMYRLLYKKNRNWFFDQWVSYCCKKNTGFKRRSKNSLFDFSEYINEELNHISSGDPQILESPVISHGLYYQQLSRFHTLFQKDQFLILENTDLTKNTVDVLKQIENFLKIDNFDWSRTCLKRVFQGVYHESINNKTGKKLSKYYSTENEKLFELINRRFQWGIS